jgi:uncharacterized protein
MTKILCVYHANCADGFASAWAVHRALGSTATIEYRAASYGEAPPLDAVDRETDVLVVDFLYPREELEVLASAARTVLVLDHHKTAAEALAGLPEPPTPHNYERWLRSFKEREPIFPNLVAIFDMERSGAGLTWDYLSGGAPRPPLIDLVEDRDLWKFELGDATRDFHAVAASHRYSLDPSGGMPSKFELWTLWNKWAEAYDRGGWGSDHTMADCWLETLREGTAIIRAQDQLIDGILRGARRTMVIGGVPVPVANVPGALASEAGNRLCQETDSFTATYYDGRTERHFSLRSPPNGADVGEIARRYGGGGHAHAAGFARPIGWDGDPGNPGSGE